MVINAMEPTTPRKTTIITLQELEEKGACLEGCDLFTKHFPSEKANYWDVIKECVALKKFDSINWILRELDFTLPDLVLDKLPDEPVFVYPGKVIIKGDIKITGKVLAKGGLYVSGKLTICRDACIWGRAKADEINVSDVGWIRGGVYSETINVSDDGCIGGGVYSETINVSDRGNIHDGAYGKTVTGNWEEDEDDEDY
jgi:cytoskeletal protein CcmA (bactofilin family)